MKVFDAYGDLGQGATEAEIAEALDVGLLMGGSVSAKSVRHAYGVIDAVRTRGER